MTPAALRAGDRPTRLSPLFNSKTKSDKIRIFCVFLLIFKNLCLEWWLSAISSLHLLETFLGNAS